MAIPTTETRFHLHLDHHHLDQPFSSPLLGRGGRVGRAVGRTNHPLRFSPTVPCATPVRHQHFCRRAHISTAVDVVGDRQSWVGHRRGATFVHVQGCCNLVRPAWRRVTLTFGVGAGGTGPCIVPSRGQRGHGGVSPSDSPCDSVRSPPYGPRSAAQPTTSTHNFGERGTTDLGDGCPR